MAQSHATMQKSTVQQSLCSEDITTNFNQMCSSTCGVPRRQLTKLKCWDVYKGKKKSNFKGIKPLKISSRAISPCKVGYNGLPTYSITFRSVKAKLNPVHLFVLSTYLVILLLIFLQLFPKYGFIHHVLALEMAKISELCGRFLCFPWFLYSVSVNLVFCHLFSLKTFIIFALKSLLKKHYFTISIFSDKY